MKFKKGKCNKICYYLNGGPFHGQHIFISPGIKRTFTFRVVAGVLNTEFYGHYVLIGDTSSGISKNGFWCDE